MEGLSGPELAWAWGKNILRNKETRLTLPQAGWAPDWSHQSSTLNYRIFLILYHKFFKRSKQILFNTLSISFLICNIGIIIIITSYSYCDKDIIRIDAEKMPAQPLLTAL